MLTECLCIPSLNLTRSKKPEQKGKRFSIAEQKTLIATEKAKQIKFQSEAEVLRKQSKNPFSSQRNMSRRLKKDANISATNIEEIKKLSKTEGYAKVQKTKSGRNLKIQAW